MQTYIVFDLEWNQCPDGREYANADLLFEIIEIGAIKLDEHYIKIDEFHYIIKPVVYHRLHPHIKEVVDLRMEDLKRAGKPFKQVINAFLKWVFKEGEIPSFCTWGSHDLMELQKNMAFHRIESPFAFPLLYYDLQKLYSLSQGWHSSISRPLDKVVLELGIKIQRPFHRALDDAYYTGLVLQKMDLDSVKEYQSMDYFKLPSVGDEEVYLHFPSYDKYVSRNFCNKEEAFSDKKVREIICPICHRMLRKKLMWFSSNQKIFLCLGYCREHGYVKGKIRLKNHYNGTIFVVKTTKFANEETVQTLKQRKVELAKKRSQKNRARKKRVLS